MGIGDVFHELSDLRVVQSGTSSGQQNKLTPISKSIHPLNKPAINIGILLMKISESVTASVSCQAVQKQY